MTTKPKTEIEDYALDSNTAIEKAKKDGNTVVLPEPNQLLIDVDDPADLAKLFELFPILTRSFKLAKWVMTPSKGASRYHVVMTLDRAFNDTERILLQACLGSDRKRELLSFVRVTKGDPHPSLLIEPGAAPLAPPAPDKK